MGFNFRCRSQRSRFRGSSGGSWSRSSNRNWCAISGQLGLNLLDKVPKQRHNTSFSSPGKPRFHVSQLLMH